MVVGGIKAFALRPLDEPYHLVHLLARPQGAKGMLLIECPMDAPIDDVDSAGERLDRKPFEARLDKFLIGVERIRLRACHQAAHYQDERKDGPHCASSPTRKTPYAATYVGRYIACSLTDPDARSYTYA